MPIYRGMKLSEDDKIVRHLMNDVRTYFEVDFEEYKNIFNINFKDYFSKEINSLSEYINDGLVVINDKKIEITGLGTNFTHQISNVFDKYDPPTSNYEKRLEKIKKVAVHPS